MVEITAFFVLIDLMLGGLGITWCFYWMNYALRKHKHIRQCVIAGLVLFSLTLHIVNIDNKSTFLFIMMSCIGTLVILDCLSMAILSTDMQKKKMEQNE